MLINDDSKGTSDGKEKDQLQAVIAVGSEFMTYRDAESTVQRSGEFVRIEKESGDSQPRFLLMHETAQTYREENGTLFDLTGNELRALPSSTKLRKRSRLFMSEIDTAAGDLPFREIGGFKAQSRIPRFRGIETATIPRTYEATAESQYTAQAGKRRLFPKGDGKVLLAREVSYPDDPRYFNDSDRIVVGGFSKKRGLRAARVELVEVNPSSGSVSAPIFWFDIHSGLGFSPAEKFFSNTIRNASADMYNDSNVFAAFSGVNYGSSLMSASSTTGVPIGGDASDTYAICEPGLAKSNDGREYTSIIAVYPAPDDVYDARGSGPYRLTVKRTVVGGGVAMSKINFPALPSRPQHYLSARGMSLHRLGPSIVVLRILVHAMQFGVGGSIQPSISDVFFMWSLNNGESWTYVPPSVGFPGVFPYGGMLVKDKDTILAFSSYSNFLSSPVEVHRVTIAGTSLLSTIPGAVFGAGLIRPTLSGTYTLTAYTPVGFGGAVYRRTPEGKKKRLWMQFDPQYIYSADTDVAGNPVNLAYPGLRPMLLVSDDGGGTWARRLMPSEWSFRVGFVVAIDEKTLAVPVLSARKANGAAVRATIYLSDNGGDSWKATGAQITLPNETWTDGQIVVGGTYTHPVYGDSRFEQDLSDANQQFNRGELLPMIALRDAQGELLPSNPARPWMASHQFKEPSYA